jgi:hypothetical protein
VILLIINTLALKTFLSIIKQNIKKGCVAHPRYRSQVVRNRLLGFFVL